MNYYDQEGNEITKAEITRAVQERRAVIVWSHGEWCTRGLLCIEASADAAERLAKTDTRGECWSAWDEAWAEMCTDVTQALRGAAGKL